MLISVSCVVYHNIYIYLSLSLIPILFSLYRHFTYEYSHQIQIFPQEIAPNSPHLQAGAGQLCQRSQFLGGALKWFDGTNDRTNQQQYWYGIQPIFGGYPLVI